MREDAPTLPPRGREVATVLVAVGRERASRLLAHFDPEEVAVLRTVGARGRQRLPNVSAGELAAITERFEHGFEQGPGVVGAGTSFDAILAEVEAPATATGEATPRADAPAPGDAERNSRWQAVAAAPDGELVPWLSSENEAVAALVLARLPPARSAALLTQMSSAVCSAVVGALPHVDAGPGAEDIVLDLLEAELLEGGADNEEETQSLLAGIVNELEPELGETVTRRLTETLPPDRMAGIASRIFRFEDIARIEAAGRASLLGAVPSEQLVLALTGADTDMREAVLSSLGQRTRRMVEADLDADLPTKGEAVRTARRAIAQRAVALAREGAFELPRAA